MHQKNTSMFMKLYAENLNTSKNVSRFTADNQFFPRAISMLFVAIAIVGTVVDEVGKYMKKSQGILSNRKSTLV